MVSLLASRRPHDWKPSLLDCCRIRKDSCNLHQSKRVENTVPLVSLEKCFARDRSKRSDLKFPLLFKAQKYHPPNFVQEQDSQYPPIQSSSLVTTVVLSRRPYGGSFASSVKNCWLAIVQRVSSVDGRLRCRCFHWFRRSPS